MALGYYPYVSVGLLTANIDVPIGMRFRDIRFNQSDVSMASSTTTQIVESATNNSMMASPGSSPTIRPSGAPIIVSTTGIPMVGSGGMITSESLKTTCMFDHLLQVMFGQLVLMFIHFIYHHITLSRNERGRFGALKSDSTHHFFRNACTKSGSLRFSQFSGC